MPSRKLRRSFKSAHNCGACLPLPDAGSFTERASSARSGESSSAVTAKSPTGTATSKTSKKKMSIGKNSLWTDRRDPSTPCSIQAGTATGNSPMGRCRDWAVTLSTWCTILPAQSSPAVASAWAGLSPGRTSATLPVPTMSRRCGFIPRALWSATRRTSATVAETASKSSATRAYWIWWSGILRF